MPWKSPPRLSPSPRSSAHSVRIQHWAQTPLARFALFELLLMMTGSSLPPPAFLSLPQHVPVPPKPPCAHPHDSPARPPLGGAFYLQGTPPQPSPESGPSVSVGEGRDSCCLGGGRGTRSLWHTTPPVHPASSSPCPSCRPLLPRPSPTTTTWRNGTARRSSPRWGARF